MATKKKLLQAAAGNAGGEVLNVEDVFSTYLYTGTGSTQTITNGIDLAGEGGLVWTKRRAGGNSSYSDHWLVDSERGDSYGLRSNLTNAQFQDSSLGFSSSGYTAPNSIHFTQNATDYASWTFLKSKRFFDIQTWTGNSTSGREIAHNLGSVPGMIIVKSLTEARQWMVYHRSTGNANALILNSTAASASTALWNSTDPTSTAFTLNNDGDVNTTGNTYVAYLFAHNDGDGEFGPDADADIIKCGSYTGNSGGSITETLGFEPQWLLVKNATTSANWVVLDNMRNMSWDAANAGTISANRDYAEQDVDEPGAPRPEATGFGLASGNNYAEYNFNTNTFIYIAIRRGTKVPESATEVFAIDTASGTSPTPPTFTSGFPVDMYLYKRADLSQNWRLFDRMRGDEVYLKPNNTEADDVTGDDSGQHNDLMTGIGTATFTNSNLYQWMWKRAHSYMDCVAYFGNSTAGRTVSHNLGVAPEMIFVKARAGTYAASSSFMVYHSGVGATKALYINADYGPSTGNWWNNTAPTDTNFSVGDNYQTNDSASTFISYLFASLDGISKVGSYTGNGSSQTINCGFTNGARFVMTKRSDSTGNWNVWDAERGIVAGNDPRIELNDQYGTIDSGHDYIDPHNSGFIVNYVANDADDSNVNGATYIFYAIA